MRKTPIIIVLVLLAISALLHLVRQSTGVHVTIGRYVYPVWASGFAFGIGTMLFIWCLFAVCYPRASKFPIILMLILLLLSGLGQLARFILHAPVAIGKTFSFAPWTGCVAFLIATLLVFWSFYSLYKSDEKNRQEDESGTNSPKN